MGTKGVPAWNSGKKFPHTKEWEERRIAAVKKAASTRVYPKGYHRPPEHTQAMLKAFAKKVSENPEKYRQISINNLSGNRGNPSKEKSPQWKGGITEKHQQWRSEHGKDFELWRKSVYARDGFTCRECGAKKHLEAHHIIPVSQCREVAFLRMNGVTLCKKCHKLTKSYGGRSRGTIAIGKTRLIIQTIPHKYQDYETVGNWNFANGVLLVFVSDMGDPRYNFLVGIHEAVEAMICKHRGVKEEDITAFDVEFEKNRPEGNEDEPGDDPNAPYKKEHFTATNVERIVAAELDVDWNEYDKAVMSL